MLGDFRDVAPTSDNMPYGGIPYKKYIPKFEKTDPNIIKTGIDAGNHSNYGSDSNYLSYNNIHDEDPYNNYARSEIVDRALDNPLFESDHSKRDSSRSKSVVNLRYNGNRGNTSDLPRHPELFIGFTGNDPRGNSEDPRFDQFRGFMTSQAANLQVRMGNNDDNHIAERPWTNQSISYDKKYLQKQQANNLKIFNSQKEGRPNSRNVVTDMPTWGKNQNKIRSSTMNAADESIRHGDYGEYIDIGGEVNQILSNDLQVIKTMKAPSNLNKLHTDQDFYSEIDNVQIGMGNNYLSNNVGLRNTGFDHIDISAIGEDELITNGLNKKNLASSMALAAKTASNMKNMSSHNIQNPNIDHDNKIMGQKIANDISNIYKKLEYGQKYGESSEGINTGGGLIQQRTTGVGKNVVHDPNANISQRMETVSNIVRGLKENTASSKRKIANQVINQFAVSPVDRDMTTKTNMMPSKNHIKSRHIPEINSAVFKNFVNDRTEINKFKPSIRREKRVQFAKHNDITNWNGSYQTANGKNTYHKDDHNRTNKIKSSLDSTNWQNSAEMEMLKNKNPELYNRVKQDAEMSVMNWAESEIAAYGANVHEREKNIMKMGQHTYNPNTWHSGYTEPEARKAKGLPEKRRSAQNESTEFDNYFNVNHQSFAPSAASSGPKTLRGGQWNTDIEGNGLNGFSNGF
uniref:Uncharacterized protein n=1 Tax=viral metagenome TaxID=1070528 RepID=A0A6C0I0W0_9ZZZZ